MTSCSWRIFLALTIFTTGIAARENEDGPIAAECPSGDPSNPLEWLSGSWIATWNGVPEKKYFVGGQRFDTGHFVIDASKSAEKLVIRGSAWFRGGVGDPRTVPDQTITINPIELEPKNANFLQTHFLFYSAPLSFIQLNSQSPDKISGTWEISDKEARGGKFTGSVVWERVKPKIKRLIFDSEIDLEVDVTSGLGERDLCGAQLLIKENLGVVRKTYSRAEWSDEFNNMRAQRPRFHIDIYGDDLWGARWDAHKIWIDEANTGIEATKPMWIRSEEDSGKIIGLRVRFNIWYGVVPGKYTAYFDDYAIPFVLDIPNWTPKVTMSVVRYDDETNEEIALEEVPIGQAFWIKADVKNPERFDASEPMTVYWKKHEFTAPARKLNDEEYRAGPFFVWEDVMPESVVPPEPCER